MVATVAGAAAAGTPVRGAAASRGARLPGTGRSCGDLRRAGGDGGDARGGGSRTHHGGCAKSLSVPGSPDDAPMVAVVVAAVVAAVPAAARNASDDSVPGRRPCSLLRP